MIIESQAVGPFFKNGFVVACEETREAVLIDPGDEVESLLAFAQRNTLAIHAKSIRELEDGLAPELRDELDRLTLPFTEGTVPSDGEPGQ